MLCLYGASLIPQNVNWWKRQTNLPGITGCDIRSIILPLLADHVLRETNHYLWILNRKGNKQRNFINIPARAQFAALHWKTCRFLLYITSTGTMIPTDFYMYWNRIKSEVLKRFQQTPPHPYEEVRPLYCG